MKTFGNAKFFIRIIFIITFNNIIKIKVELTVESIDYFAAEKCLFFNNGHSILLKKLILDFENSRKLT